MVVVASATLASVAADDVLAPSREGNAKGDVVTDADLTSRVLQAVAPTCADFVDCVDGKVRGTGDSCRDACDGGGNCCKGYDACVGFTGKVCKDGYSCDGDYACYGAKIPFVVDSCYNPFACAFAKTSSSLNGCCNEDYGECMKYSEKDFVAKRSDGCSVRECNIFSPCFIQSCFYPCSYLSRAIKNTTGRYAGRWRFLGGDGRVVGNILLVQGYMCTDRIQDNMSHGRCSTIMGSLHCTELPSGSLLV